jgi:hypothetical protein
LAGRFGMPLRQRHKATVPLPGPAAAAQPAAGTAPKEA